jgi:hypothetical protein
MELIEGKEHLWVDANFPGGNILVEAMRGDTVWLRQDLRTNIDDWFYWNFRVQGAAGKKIHFFFTGGDVFGARGPCFSADGSSWQWLGRDILVGDSFSYSFPNSLNQAYFAFSIPYTEQTWRSFLEEHLASKELLEREESVLTHSEKGRPVEKLTQWSKQGAQKILLTARHHACEGMANFVLEGLLAYLLNDSAEADFLRNQVDVHIVPFVDKDGVEDGDQGKMRLPHDHWEDYSNAPIYTPTRAIMEQSLAWRGKFSLAIDLHCPAMRGDIHDEIFVVEPEPAWMPEMNRFYDFLETESQSSLPFDRKKSFPYGYDWNVAGPNCSDYFRNQRQVLAFTLEFPYAQAGSKTVTVDNARQFGKALGKAVGLYLRETSSI